jgi:hypothetical protein
MKNGCQYRSICMETLKELKNDGFKDGNLLDRWEFNLIYGQHFSVCSQSRPKCQIYWANERIQKLKPIDEKAHVRLLKGFLS